MGTRLQLENLATKKGISDPHEKTTESLAYILLTEKSLSKKDLIAIARSMAIKTGVDYHLVLY